MSSLDHQGAPWLATMQDLAGTKEYVGGANNPTILGWARFIGLTYPEMSAYADGYKHDSIPWCGLTMAYALAKNGIKPPFGDSDLQRFLWANSFASDPAYVRTDPRPGAIVVFKWSGGGGHVGIVDRIESDRVWVAGGNQTDAVNVAPFRRDNQVVGYFWPEKVAAAAAPVRTPADVRQRMGKAITLAEARRDAQGRLAVFRLPANDGGGAYEVAGINVRFHPVAAEKLKTMIESGRFAEAEAFVGDYTGSYTDVADAWTVSWGIEFYLRDCVFNRGPTGAAKIMQRALKLRGEPLDQAGPKRDGVDGDVGPVTAAAMRRKETDVEAMLMALRQAREDYEAEDVGWRENFKQGLLNRFNNALTVARRFHAEQPKESIVNVPTLQPPPAPGSQPLIPDLTNIGVDPKKMQDVLQAAMIAMLVIQMMQGKQVQFPTNLLTGPSTQPEAPPVVQPPAPPPVVPPSDTNRGTDLFAKIFGFLGLIGAAVGQGTGVAPFMGPEATTVGTTVAGTSLAALAGGIIGIFNPALGGLVKGIGGAFTGARQAFQQPPQNPPTR
jgi:uncharacterized protein (TIGR02594 family)